MARITDDELIGDLLCAALDATADLDLAHRLIESLALGLKPSEMPIDERDLLAEILAARL